ncbi:MAG: AAA family ATPase [Bacteroidales bacterium]|nr:AAA family ATPase [Bacteroidales bacterium]
MRKIEIHNFGPIKHAVIEIKPLLVFIGEQASGKSTIAKLIYFFETIPTDFYLKYYQSQDAKFDMTSDLLIPIRNKFYDLFGSTKHLYIDFQIIYYYAEDKNLTLTLTQEKKLYAHFSKKFIAQNIVNELFKVKNDLIQLKNDLEGLEMRVNVAQRVALQELQLNKLHVFNDLIYSIFDNKHNDELFIIAGRNATVGYSETFEDLFQQHLEKQLTEQGKRIFSSKEQTIDETLMLYFMERVKRMKSWYRSYGDFDGMIHQSDNKDRLSLAYELVNQVLKGQYSSDSNFGEYIQHSDGSRVYLKDASSGQQEAIRILQDSFLCIFQNNKIFRIVEEPEVHLFPEAQKATIQLLVLMLNNNENNNLILTTHSPYTLTVINNLIFAAKIGKKNAKKVDDIISKELWLSTERVAAYILKNGVAENIIDNELGEIKAELIDEVSTEINNEYSRILDIKYDD